MRFSPVVLLAPARSLSSVVSSMIGSHPELYGFPELTLFDTDTVGERLDSSPKIGKPYPGWNPVAGLERAVAQVLAGNQSPKSINFARSWLETRRYWSGADVLDILMERIAPRIGVEKSPDTVNGEQHLARVIDWYPNVRLVHLVRHPVPAIRSVQAHYFIFDHPVHCARGWLAQHQRIERFIGSLPAEQWIRVRAEDVLNDSRRELRRIAKWIGVRTDDKAIDSMCHPERSIYSGMGPERQLGGNDPGFLKDPKPRQAVLPPDLELPEEWKVHPDIAADIRSLAARLGYS